MGFLGWLLGKNKQVEEVEEQEEIFEEAGPLVGEELKEAVLNCCEQAGAFDEFGIEDQEVIDNLCSAVASALEGKELTHSNISNALGEGFASLGYEVKGTLASTFASAYISSYR